MCKWYIDYSYRLCTARCTHTSYPHMCKWYIDYSYRLCIARCTHTSYPHMCKWYIDYSYRLCIARCTHTSYPPTHTHTHTPNSLALHDSHQQRLHQEGQHNSTCIHTVCSKHYKILLQCFMISLVSFHSSCFLTSGCGMVALYHLKEDRVFTP